MSEQIVEISQVRRKYQHPSPRERELEVKNLRLQEYVSRLLEERTTLAKRVRELEAAR